MASLERMLQHGARRNCAPPAQQLCPGGVAGLRKAALSGALPGVAAGGRCCRRTAARRAKPAVVEEIWRQVLDGRSAMIDYQHLLPDSFSAPGPKTDRRPDRAPTPAGQENRPLLAEARLSPAAAPQSRQQTRSLQTRRSKPGWKQHDFTAQQILQRLQAEGVHGRLHHRARVCPVWCGPNRSKRFPDAPLCPGRVRQVDWGSWGFMPVGNTRRRLSFFVVVLCYSRMLYVEFTLGQSQEHFLACHQHAF